MQVLMSLFYDICVNCEICLMFNLGQWWICIAKLLVFFRDKNFKLQKIITKNTTSSKISSICHKSGESLSKPKKNGAVSRMPRGPTKKATIPTSNLGLVGLMLQDLAAEANICGVFFSLEVEVFGWNRKVSKKWEK